MLTTKIVKLASDASVVVKAGVAAVLILYSIALIPGAYSVLAIQPGLLLPPNFRVWTFLTGLLTEASILNVMVDIPILLLCGIYIEPLWGALEFLKFIALTGTGTALMMSFISLATYAATQNYTFCLEKGVMNQHTFWAPAEGVRFIWFVGTSRSVELSGLAGVIGALTVAFKQVMPDQKIDLKYKTFFTRETPFLCLFVYIVLSALGVWAYTQPVMVVCGCVVGWTYLRFYQSRGKSMRGDMSENFEFATLFPNLFRPPVRIVSSAVFALLVRVNICKKPIKTYDVGAPSSITISLPGVDPADAERRRRKALRALNDRLEQIKTKSTEAEHWPTIGDELDRSTEIVEKLQDAAVEIPDKPENNA